MGQPRCHGTSRGVDPFPFIQLKSGSLPPSSANGGGQGCLVSERIDRLKTAGAADIEMGVFFLREVGPSSCESKDVQGMNMTSCRRRTVTSTLYTEFVEFLHYSPSRLG